jgi:hypothetical protein
MSQILGGVVPQICAATAGPTAALAWADAVLEGLDPDAPEVPY